MPKRHFEPVEFEYPKNRGLRPLFTGRIAHALDTFAGSISVLYGSVFVLVGLGLLSYNLYSIVLACVSREAWLTLICVVLAMLPGVFFFLRSSLINRLVLLASLAALSFVATPIIERMLA